METEPLIRAEIICSAYNIDLSFIYSLHETGLVEINSVEGHAYIMSSQLGEIERLIRLHHELEINLEGLEAIGHLLKRIQDLSEENRRLRNHLHPDENFE